MLMPTIGLIAEGPTDHVVLENILIGHFDDYDMSQYIRYLQPLRDATDAAGSKGGWTRVLEYCRSTLFRDAFEENDFLIIQIDSDRLNEKPFELNLAQPVEILIEQAVQQFEQLIILAFGVEFLTDHRMRIIFAIAVNEIECWLLPLLFSDKTASATNNCLFKLNQQLSTRKEKPIHPKAKAVRQYEQLSRDFCKPKSLVVAAQKNPSLGIFSRNLDLQFHGQI